MRIGNLFLVVMILSISSVVSYPREEVAFEGVVSAQASSSGVLNKNGDVLSVMGLGQFFNVLMQNEKPVVISVVPPFDEGSFGLIYKEVAHEFLNKVVFVDVNIKHRENGQVLKWIMEQLRVDSISIPFFLFFKEQKLISMPVQFPLFKRDVHPDVIKEFRSHFVDQIKRLFFSSNQKVLLHKSGGDVQSKKGDSSTLSKIERLCDKMNDWLHSFKNISKQEVRACRLSDKPVRMKEY